LNRKTCASVCYGPENLLKAVLQRTKRRIHQWPPIQPVAFKVNAGLWPRSTKGPV
jgi:hypothetical protein